ncbi:hypothetical protein PFICI_12337 [Pestalotiopsis fici W106-1]|uniref:Uncharacterized protein n=1 Tax=Pestalotiopsis fici (strain W106-1 / CGMCC3.15140) TaxID=1229662 RepID=W3WNF9_PESFW|nr:uncharacterized protein PFICI_12337 [Pestalotiopsis fici W106-1]ETS75393.1 hypothetical protein PFICI_12337 [Pestalotiopsis fici W106-1]
MAFARSRPIGAVQSRESVRNGTPRTDAKSVWGSYDLSLLAPNHNVSQSLSATSREIKRQISSMATVGNRQHPLKVSRKLGFEKHGLNLDGASLEFDRIAPGSSKFAPRSRINGYQISKDTEALHHNKEADQSHTMSEESDEE